MERMPIPMKHGDTLYTECETQAPTPRILGETQKLVKNAGLFQAYRFYCSRCITAFKTAEGQTIDDPVSVKALVPKMYFKSVDWAAVQSLLKHYDSDDGVEGLYPCPLCGTMSRAEYVVSDGVVLDTRDKITDFEVTYFDVEKDSLVIHKDLTDPVLILDKRTDQPIEGGEILSVDVEIPTLENSINAESKVGAHDSIELQIAIYAEALRKVNGLAIDATYRNTFGTYIFGNIKAIKQDIGYISKEINRYGVDKTKEKTCKNCGKVWRAVINTSNFSEPALPIF